METKAVAPKKEKTVAQSNEQWFSEMTSGLIGMYKEQLNLAVELNNNIVKSITSVQSITEKMPLTDFYKMFLKTDIEKPLFTPFLTLDGNKESAEKLLKEISDAYNKQLDISIETNKELMTEFNKQFTKAIKTYEESIPMNGVLVK